jgi:hypothetical protein
MSRKKPAKKVVEIKNEESVEQIELEDSFIRFYMKETGRKHVTKKGITKFLTHLLENFSSHPNSVQE